MTVTPELIEAAKNEIQIKQHFELTDTVTATYILFEQFIEGTKWKRLPKFVFYVLIQDAFGGTKQKDEKNGFLGYALKLRQVTEPPTPSNAETKNK